MKNINVQHEVEYHQNNEKIEDLRMILESCARNAGLPIGFSAVITRAGVAVPLPLLPPRPLLHPDCLGNMAAGMLHPLEGTLRCTDVGSTVGRFFRDFDM